jgi:hypothetical protein
MELMDEQQAKDTADNAVDRVIAFMVARPKTVLVIFGVIVAVCIFVL